MKVLNIKFHTFSKYNNLRMGSYYELPKIQMPYCPLSKVILPCESGSRPAGGIKEEYEGQAISLGGEQIGSDGDLDVKKLPYVPFEYFSAATCGKVADGDILICKDGSLTGKVCIVDKTLLPHEKVMVNEHVYVIRSNDKVNQMILFFLMRMDSFKKQVIDLAYRKKGQPGLNSDHLKSILIPNLSQEIQDVLLKKITPLLEEIKILKGQIKNNVLIIDSVFAKLYDFNLTETYHLGKGMSYGTQRLQTKKLLIFNKKFSEFYSKLLRFSVRACNPIVRILQNTLFKLNVIKVKTILTTPAFNGESPIYKDDGTIPVIKTAHLNIDGLITDGLEFVSEAQYNNSLSAKLICGDVLICNIGKGSLGKTTINNTNNKLFAASEVTILRVDKQKYNNQFLQYFLTSILGVFQFEQAYTGATNQIHLDPKALEEFYIPDITLDEQQKIVDAIQLEIDKQNEIKNQIAILRGKIDSIIENAIISND